MELENYCVLMRCIGVGKDTSVITGCRDEPGTAAYHLPSPGSAPLHLPRPLTHLPHFCVKTQPLMFNDIHDRFNYIPYSHYRYVDVVNNIHIRVVPQLLHAFLPIDGSVP